MNYVLRAGRERLADKLYDLRCAIAAADYGQPPFLTVSSTRASRPDRRARTRTGR